MKAKLFSSIINIVKNTVDEIIFNVCNNQIFILINTNEMVFNIELTDEEFTLEDGKYTIVYQTLQKMCKNVRSDSTIKITNNLLLFQITNGFRTVVYECPCTFEDEYVPSQRLKNDLQYLSMKTIELKDICKSLVNTTERFKIKQFENGIIVSTIDSVLNQSVIIGVVEKECIHTNVIPNIVLQRLLRVSCSHLIGLNSRGCLFSINEGITCQIQFC